jgi:hypothetical protein
VSHHPLTFFSRSNSPTSPFQPRRTLNPHVI